MAIFREDPYADFNFLVEIDGFDGGSIQAGFAEVSGLGVTIDPVEYRNGNEEIAVRKLPGLRKYTNITLKRGVIGDLSFWEWVKSALDGKVDRRSVVIKLLDEQRETVLQWSLRRAWPCGYEGPHLRAGDSRVAIESLEICHEGLELA